MATSSTAQCLRAFSTLMVCHLVVRVTDHSPLIYYRAGSRSGVISSSAFEGTQVSWSTLGVFVLAILEAEAVLELEVAQPVAPVDGVEALPSCAFSHASDAVEPFARDRRASTIPLPRLLVSSFAPLSAAAATAGTGGTGAPNVGGVDTFGPAGVPTAGGKELASSEGMLARISAALEPPYSRDST